MSPARKPKAPTGVEVVERRNRAGETYERYRVRWVDHTGKRRSDTYTDLQRARDRVDELRRIREAGDLDRVDRGVLTFGNWFEEHYFPRADQVLEGRTAKRYSDVYNQRLSPTIGHIPLRRIDAPLVRKVIDGQVDLTPRPAGKPAPPAGVATRRYTLAVLSAALTDAVRHGELTGNPCHGIKAVQAARRETIVHCATVPEVERIRGKLELQEHRLLVSILAYVGLRPEEALALTDAAVDDAVVRIDRRCVDGRILVGDKRHRTKTVVIPKPVRAEIAAWRLARPGGLDVPLLFPRPSDGRPWRDHDYRNWRERKFDQAVRDARSQVAQPYHLRHACASLLLQAGWSLPEVAEQLGHGVQVLSDTYAHVIKAARHSKPVPLDQQIARARKPSTRRTA